MIQKRDEEPPRSRTRLMSDNQPIQIDEFLEDNGSIHNMGRGLFYNQDKPVSEFTTPFENSRLTQPETKIPNHV